MQFKNLFNMGLSTLRANITDHAVPLNVMISVTNRCPARCSYCTIPNRRQHEMSTSEIIRLFDELKTLGTQRIALWGGEPLIREDIGDLIDYAKIKCNFFVSLDSNGYLVPDKINLLKNIDVLVLSLDGTKDVHDHNRESGSYEKVIEALKIACRSHRVFTITVLTRENIGQIDFILDKARELGFYSTFQLLHLTKNLGPSDESSLMPSDEEYRSAIKHIIKRKQEGFPIVSSFSYLKHLLQWKDYQRSVSTEEMGLKCWAGKLYCNVDTDGTVYPCSRTIGLVPAKNFLKTGFKEAFDFIRENDCKSCFASSFVEYNLIHGLNPEVIWNWMKYTSK